MAKQFRGNVEAVDKAIAAAIQALESYREPNPWYAFDQVGYMMSALYRWAREKEHVPLRFFTEESPAALRRGQFYMPLTSA